MQTKEAVFRQKTFGIEEIAEVMLSNPDLYVNRRPAGWSRLDLAAVLRTLDATFLFIEEKLMAGQAVHVRGFATFAFRKDREDADALDTLTRADVRSRAGCCGGGGGGGGGGTPHVHETSFLPLFRLDRAMAARTGLCEARDLDLVPKYMGSIWSSRAKPVPPNPYVIAHAAGVERAFAVDVLLDFFLAAVDTMAAGRRVVLPMGLGTLTFEGSAAQGGPARAGLDPAKLVAFKWRKELVRWIKGGEERARESNRHAVGHRRFFESSETVSDAWKRSPQDMLPRREMLGIGAKRGNVHRPFSASSMGSQGGVGAVGRAGMSAHRNQRAEYTGGAAATMSLRPGAYENASMNATRAQQQRVRPQSAYASSAGSGSQRRRQQQQQQQYMVQEEEAWRSERRGSAGRNSFRGGGGSVAGSSSTGELF